MSGERPGTGPLTLAVTSSTGVMSLAVGRAGGDRREIEVATDRRHAEELGPRLQELLGQAGLALADVERLAVDIGPGRFTGLRVGLATVRALAFALEVPVVGLTSLSVLAAAAPAPAPTASGTPDTPTVTAVIDARRAEVFQQVFVDGRPDGTPMVGPPETLAAVARGVVVGDGVDRYGEHYGGRDGITVVSGRNPRAGTMLSLAGDDPGVPGTAITPLYLRDPDATPNIKTRPVEPEAVAGS